MLDRRQLIKSGMAAAALSLAPRPAAPRKLQLKLLVLGGTDFVGPAVVEEALEQGHEVTLFNRGKTNPELFPGVEKLRGDRNPMNPSLGALSGSRRWDAVIDVWPWEPHMVALTANLLRDRTERYLYISTVGAYKDLAPAGVTEDAPLFDDITDGAAWYEYGKAQSERVLMRIIGDRLTVCRPHIIGGYRQTGPEFPFWPVRIARGGDVFAPGDGADPVQYIDVKDVGRFTVRAVEKGLPGAYNVAGPRAEPTTMREWLEATNAAFGDRANLVWVSDDFIREKNLRHFSEIPIWLPRGRARKPGFHRVSTAKAIAAGLSFREIAQTAMDEVRWFRESRPPDFDFGSAASRGAGLSRQREAELLAEWARRRTL
jgi:2'-hydroxyisoflavone reductase